MQLLALVPPLGFLLSLWLMLGRKHVVAGAGVLVAATGISVLRNLTTGLSSLTVSDKLGMLIETLALGGALLILLRALRRQKDQTKQRAVD